MATKIRLTEAIKKLWIAACREDGIPEDTIFAVFSPANKAAKLYNELMVKLSWLRYWKSRSPGKTHY